MPSAGFLTDTLTNQSKTLFGQGTDLLGKGSNIFGQGNKILNTGVDTLGAPLSYYQGLLGNRQEALTAAAPEISTIQGQYNTAAKAVSEFSPRGGGRVAQGSELPFTKQAAIQDVINKQRPAAAQGITQIATLLGQLGISQEQIASVFSQLGISSQSLSQEGSIARGNLLLGQSSNANSTSSDLGSGIGTILAGLMGL
jgi:hypothetical protein